MSRTATISAAALRDIAGALYKQGEKLRDHDRKHAQADAKLREVEGYIALLDRHEQGLQDRLTKLQGDIRDDFAKLRAELRGLNGG